MPIVMEMLFLISDTVIQILILVGVVALFIGSLVLNKLVKPPKGIKLPEKCQGCASETCIIRLGDPEKTKEALRKYLDECDKNENSEKK